MIKFLATLFLIAPVSAFAADATIKMENVLADKHSVVAIISGTNNTTRVANIFVSCTFMSNDKPVAVQAGWIPHVQPGQKATDQVGVAGQPGIDSASCRMTSVNFPTR